MLNDIISIIIPCKNEESLISECIESILKFELPKNIKTEILIIDGISTDNTCDIIKKIQKKDDRIKLIKNPQYYQSYAMNIGIKIAKGDWILRLDAHSIYPKNYIKLCYQTAIRTSADNVGGLVISQPNGEKYQASLIQALTTHIFGVGNSGFRVGMKEGRADTVPFGFYKKEIFSKIGFFDERLVRAQDYEFNRRIIKSGGTIYLNPDIQINYYNQKTLFQFLLKQIKYEAPYNAFMWYLAPYTIAYRHAITLLFSIGFIGGIFLSPTSLEIKYAFLGVMAIYFLLSIIAALQQAIKYKKVLHLFTLPVSFFLYHFLHGLGVLFGCLNILLGTAPVQKAKEPWKDYGKFRIDQKRILNKNEKV
tara:strand:- start:894 stop:1985 length:1092 start_codon:yes stop_codon:yes gene_type:complete